MSQQTGAVYIHSLTNGSFLTDGSQFRIKGKKLILNRLTRERERETERERIFMKTQTPSNDVPFPQ